MVEWYLYLGIISGPFKLATQSRVDEAFKATFQLETNIINDLYPRLLLKIFDTLLKPTINYRSEITWKKADEQAKVFQMNWFKFIWNVNKRTSNHGVLSQHLNILF